MCFHVLLLPSQSISESGLGQRYLAKCVIPDSDTKGLYQIIN